MTDTPKIPRAPRGLQARGKSLWRDLHTTFSFNDDPHRAALIEDACRTSDVIDTLQRIVDDAGDDLRVRGSMGQPTGIPELAELRQYRSLLAALLKALALPDTDEMADIKARHISGVRRDAAKKASLKVVDHGRA
jgi:hypothetical protein